MGQSKMDYEETVLLNTKTSPNCRHPRDRRGPSISRACGNLGNILVNSNLDPGIRQDFWIPAYRRDDGSVGGFLKNKHSEGLNYA